MSFQQFHVRQVNDELQISTKSSNASVGTITADMEPINTAAKKVTGILTQLCCEYVEHGSRTCRAHNRLEILKELAQSGADLKSKIFEDQTFLTPEDPHLSNSNSQKKRIFLIRSDINVHIPWGLLFDKPEEQPGFSQSNLKEDDLKKGFWGMKYHASGLYLDGKDEFSSAQNVEVTENEFFGIFHEKAHKYADPQPFLTWPNNSVHHSIFTFKDYFKECQKGCLLYFFCHAENQVLSLKDKTSPDYFLNLLKPQLLSKWRDEKHTPMNPDFFILNGCSTGVSGPGLNWLRVTRDKGGLGFIGTEAVVPTKFAWNLGRDFLFLMFKDSCSAGEAMQKLRKQHWPLSLLYGLYCVPDTRIITNLDFLPQIDPTVNHSLIDFGERIEQSTLPFTLK